MPVLHEWAAVFAFGLLPPGVPDGGRIAPYSTQIEPLEIAGVASLLIIGLLVVLYFYRRRPYILGWLTAWTLAATATTLPTHQYAEPWSSHLAYGFSQFLGLVSAVTFFASARAYHGVPKFKPVHGWALLGALIWFTLAPIGMKGIGGVFAPGHLLIGVVLAAAGIAHITLLKKSRLIGAVVIGTMLMLAAFSHVWLGLQASGPEDPLTGSVILVSLMFYLVMALGMQLMTFEDMTYELRLANHRLKTAQGNLRQLVTTDGLTGCRNRRFFHEIIGQELQRHRRYQIPLSMVFIDVNKFKAINDTLGHETGDQFLQYVASFLMSHVRGADHVFRWGGDEFLILMSCREDEARRKGRELQEAFANAPELVTLPPGVGLSVGCSEVAPDTKDIMAVVADADERMYANKRKVRAHR